ncbi:MAG: SpoIIE family protein phosphatase [Thermoflexales bacterium]|nr:SpoIIE family protein phosphatase [Thermoflexales bacterium]
MEKKTKAQLVTELAEARSRLAELEREARERSEERSAELQREMTELGRAEKRWASERNLLRALIDSLPDYIWSKDAEGRFVLANIALAQHMGAATPDDLIGKTDFDFYPQELAAQFYADEQALIASDQSILDHEEATQDTAGNPKWTLTTKVFLRDSEDKFVGSTGVSRDITARKLAEAELARQKYILDTFMENIPDSVYFKDLASRFTRINKALALHFGLSDSAEGVGKSDYDFFPEEQARPKYEQEQEIIRTGQPILNLEEPDGIGHWALTTKMSLHDEHGKTIGTFGISHDITALKRAEAEIRALNKKLQAENLRMEAELDVTRRLQQMLLPTDEELRQIEGLDIAGFMQPAEEVGGDYYDVLPYNGSIKISIGDVTGHGLESGMVMLMLQTAVRTLQMMEVKDPGRFLDMLNRLLWTNLQRMKVDKSATLALLDYELGRTRLRLSGQHEQLIVLRRDGKVELIDTLDLGFPLGIESGIAHFVREMPPVELEPGDGVVLYSDGITEAENEAKEFYGLERLCQVVSAHWGEPAEAIKDAVVADVQGFIGQQKIYDDLTLLVVKQK